MTAANHHIARLDAGRAWLIQRELRMRKVAMTLLTFALGAAFAVVFLTGRDAVEGQAQPAAPAGGFSAVPNAIGTQDFTGHYEVV
jgi:hypothetical protein